MGKVRFRVSSELARVNTIPSDSETSALSEYSRSIDRPGKRGKRNKSKEMYIYAAPPTNVP